MTLTKPKPKRVTPVHRKRTAQHHGQGHHYTKVYLPYLPVFAILGIGILVNSWLSQAHRNVLGYATNINSQQLLAETNTARAASGQTALQANARLAEAAQAKANDIATLNYWSHVSPQGAQPWNFIEAAGYNYSAAGENLAYGFGSSEQVVEAWLQSNTHRANMLNGLYSEVGFAAAHVPDFLGEGPQTVVVALYGAPVSENVAVKSGAIQLASNSSQPVSRMQLVTGATWVQLALAALCGAALTLFFVRHAYAWHRVLARGEHFVLTHPFFDIMLVVAFTTVLLLYNIAGNIL